MGALSLRNPTSPFIGDYLWTAEGEANEWRRLFLIEIANSSRTTLKELADLLPAYKKTVRRIADRETAGDLIEGEAAWLAAPLYGKLRRWQGKHHLETDWVTRTAIKTLRYWVEENPNSTGVCFVPLGVLVDTKEFAVAFAYGTDVVGLSPQEQAAWKQTVQNILDEAEGDEPPLPPPGYPIWYPFGSTQKGYLAGVEREARKQLEKARGDHALLIPGLEDQAEHIIRSILETARHYCDQVERRYRRGEWRPAPRKPAARKHVAWTVQVQVVGKTVAEVAREAGVEPPAVSSRVREVLRLIDLPPRKGLRPGRPRGRSDSTFRIDPTQW